MNIKKDIRFRVYVAFTGMCLFGLAILIKVVMLQVKEGPKLRALAENIHTRSTVLPADRGNIYTEGHDLLCSTIPLFDVFVDFSVIDSSLFYQNVDTLSRQLSTLLKDRSSSAYERELKAAYRDKEHHKYWSLCKNVQYNEYQEMRAFNIFNRGKNRGGFIVEPKTNRINPYGMLAYRTIGLWRENAQTVGLEATYDSVLRGYSGSRVEQKMTGNVWMPIEGSVIEPKNGKDIITTLDLDIQGIAEFAVKDLCEKYDLQYGTCVVMEVATGKIRALVNLGCQDDGKYFEDFNYAMIPTEPGSVFKLVTLTALLNDKYVTIDNIVDAEGGRIRFGNLTMKDSHFGLGKLTIKDAFAHSSNTAHAKLANQYYYKEPEKFVAQVKKLHLHEKTGIDLAGERRPVVKTPESKSWSQTTLPWMATGYEVQITPLHTCMLYNAVANNGKMMRPYLVSEVKEYGKTIFKRKPEVLEQAIGDSATVAQLRACVEEVALTGTAKSIQSPFYSIAGKTGTAQVADKEIKYSDGVYQGSFVGYFPANEPRYTIAVVMRTKKRAHTYYGGTIAAPVFRMIADRVFAAGKGWDMPSDSLDRSKAKVLIAQKATGSSYHTLLGAVGKYAPVREDGYIEQVSVDSSKQLVVQEQPVYKGYVPD
ncbi:MAG: penicillin-binding protein 2, partial [Chitinophagaceae bacterium]|nr:penicillin-binding protein 2 [Chitinophagaceae bacterium]